MNMEKFTELFRNYVATVMRLENQEMAKMASLHAELTTIPQEEQDEQQISEA